MIEPIYFSALLMFADVPDGGVCFRQDYLPRRKFDRLTFEERDALFPSSQALGWASLLAGLVFATLADPETRTLLTKLARNRLTDPESLSWLVKSRMRRPLLIQNNVALIAPEKLWPFRPVELKTKGNGSN